MRFLLLTSTFTLFFLAPITALPDGADSPPDWTQWRGPNRDGQIGGPVWPERLDAEHLELLWRVPLGPSYSGPIVSDQFVFTTETKDKKSEVVLALDRKTGEQRWRTEWEGAMTVPFFAASNGSWIRSTPAYDGKNLFVAGMRDVLVCLNADTGAESWRVDFVQQFDTPLPAFGFVCSPLVDEDAVYVQAGASVVKLDKATGDVLWRALDDGGGMFGSAFSSPILADLAGTRQLLVQTREQLVGIDPMTGSVHWRQKVPAFRGMNILTPVVVGDAVFTSSYRNKSWLYRVTADATDYQVETAWSNNVQGYMSTPVVIEGHAYMHLQNRRFACIDLESGERTWTSQPFGKYASLIAQGHRILALDAGGRLLLIHATPEEFQLIDEVELSEDSTWAHLAVSGHELFVRQLGAITAYRWMDAEKK